jgi:hypothetical protein
MREKYLALCLGKNSTCWNGGGSGNETNLAIFFPNKLRACRNIELHEVIRERCAAGVFARFTYSKRHF